MRRAAPRGPSSPIDSASWKAFRAPLSKNQDLWERGERAPACAQHDGMARHLAGSEARTSGDGCADVKIRRPNGSTRDFTRCAFCSTKTIVRSFGSNGSKSLRAFTPAKSSGAVIFRVPFHPGTTFQMTVRLRDSFASCMKRKVASAVGSSLFREMKPEPLPPFDVIGPGFSNRNRISAAEPPSSGSKSGNSQSGRAVLSLATKSVSGAMCGSRRIAIRSATASAERRERASSESSTCMSAICHVRHGL